jgi:uncharacterized Zn-binding protein involved in type VI secretion
LANYGHIFRLSLFSSSRLSLPERTKPQANQDTAISFDVKRPKIPCHFSPFLRFRERRLKPSQIIHLPLGALILLAINTASEAQNTDLPSGAPAIIVEGSGNVSAGGLPAARQGDVTDNKQTLAEGSANVFINGRPAVTAGDRTGCGGVTASGASNVFINGKPMARAGDLTTACPDK